MNMTLVDSRIEYDLTDHFNIWCLGCQEVGEVVKVTTDTNKKKQNILTTIYAKCPKCKNYLKRKIYWDSK